MGTAYGIYPWGKYTGHGKSHGETFLGRLLIFVLGGGGGEEEAPGQVLLSRFRRTTRAFKQPHFFMLFYILRSGGFRCSMLQAIAKSALDLDALDRHVALFGFRQPVDLLHA